MSGLTRRSAILGACAILPALAQESRTEKIILLGDVRVRVRLTEVKRNGFPQLLYFHPHENEHAAAAVARHTIRQQGGRLLEIRCDGERLINFRLKGVGYSFDPNRIFTDAGLARSLSHFGPNSPGAMDAGRLLRRVTISQIGGGRWPIISVHNNAEGEANALAYKKGGTLSAQASKVALNPSEQPRNFFLVSNEGLFRRLHHYGFNTILQSASGIDDGSMAFYCRQNDWSYIYVEAGDADVNQQQRMLDALPKAFA